MIELSSGSNYNNQHLGEMMGIEVANWRQKPQLPRHISSLESKTHNRSNSPKRPILACPLASQQSLTSNVAWHILKYQLSDGLSDALGSPA